MISINTKISIPEDQLHFDFVRASGPGGQNVNKVASAVQLRFDVVNSPSLPAGLKKRLANLAGNRMTSEGMLVIEARRYRSQERNRQDARERFIKLLRKAAQPPKKRKPTKPSRAARGRRLQHKKRQASKKRLRANPLDEI